MTGVIAAIGLILLIWIACAVLRQIGYFSDTQFITITAAIAIVLVVVSRSIYLAYTR